MENSSKMRSFLMAFSAIVVIKTAYLIVQGAIAMHQFEYSFLEILLELHGWVAYLFSDLLVVCLYIMSFFAAYKYKGNAIWLTKFAIWITLTFFVLGVVQFLASHFHYGEFNSEVMTNFAKNLLLYNWHALVGVGFLVYLNQQPNITLEKKAA
ncbi:hypothetical protein [Thaumasiovibrio subtropicus]|uniref:hypothetical protein n=1 Tax=Thaumasiovibrio subtropicus TaxID=1891207 RepID=UPI00131BCC15|nr:hypothetical protein [Thaumasiovibrio subtropicus]